MSRFLKVMIVLLTIAAMAAPAMAEDRISLSGSYDIYGVYQDNSTDFDGDDDAVDTISNFDQRFRLGGTIAVAEGVAVKFRADIFEGDFTDGGGAISFDDAYVQFDPSFATIKAGVFYNKLGKGIACEDRSSGFSLATKGGVPVTFVYHKETEGPDAGEEDADREIYQLQVGVKSGAYNGAFFGAYLNDESIKDGNYYLIGTSFDVDMGMAVLSGELDYFGGDVSASAEAQGLQLYLDAAFKAGEGVTVGAQFLYAQGNDKADEDQVVVVSDRNAGWAPQQHGFVTALYFFGPTNIFNYAEDITGDAQTDAGIIALGAYVDAKVSDTMGIFGNLMYAMPEEDEYLDDVLDVDAETIFATIGFDYQLFANTSLKSGIHYMDVKDGDDAAISAMSYLSVKF